eukprot:7959879-Pyramimonas_sp.AAC.1
MTQPGSWAVGLKVWEWCGASDGAQRKHGAPPVSWPELQRSGTPEMREGLQIVPSIPTEGAEKSPRTGAEAAELRIVSAKPPLGGPDGLRILERPGITVGDKSTSPVKTPPKNRTKSKQFQSAAPAASKLRYLAQVRNP